MTAPDSPEITMAWPRDLRVGDRIAADFLPPYYRPAEIRYIEVDEVLPGEWWVAVAYRDTAGRFDSTEFRADPTVPKVPLERRADPTGLTHTRTDEDPQPVGGREPLHTGGVVADGVLVDETPT